MKISQAAKIWVDYHVTNSKKNTVRSHANLSTAQLYLGKISDTEAMRWVKNLYAQDASG